MRCLVTGVAGFIGSHLAERLLTEGHEVCGIDAFIDYYPRHLKESNIDNLWSWKNFNLIERNLLSVYLPPVLDGVDWVFHLAAQAGVRASWGDEFTRYADCNVLATQRLLDAVTQAKHIRRFVYASSSSIYGNTTALPVTEDTTPHPVSPYGVTKLAAEHLCSLYHQNFGVPTVALRYFTVYGPRQRPDMAFHRFCKATIERNPVHIHGDGEQTRDFTYVSDIVEANVQAAIREAAIGEVMNIAGGSRVSLTQVLHLLQDISGNPLAVVHGRDQHGDVRDTFADTTRAERLLGYSPKVSLQEGLARELEAMVVLYKQQRVPIAVA